MPPIAIGLGVSALASGAAGVAGALSNASAQQRAQLLQQEGVQQWLDVNIPDPATQKLALQQYVQTGTLHPTVEKALSSSDSEFKKIATDPALKDSRTRALASLENTGYGGETTQDAAARQQASIDSGAKNRGEQQSIISNLQQRGQAGGGLELQARLGAQQGNADQLAKSSLQQESDRRNRALQAIQGAGSLAGDIQNQSFNQQAQQAKALDAINLFNTQNAQGVNTRNAAAATAANLYNQQNAQNISNQNTQTNNYQQQYNSQLQQQQFQDQAAKAAGVSGQYNTQAQGALNAGAQQAQMFGNVASGLGNVGLASAYLSNSNPNTNNQNNNQNQSSGNGNAVASNNEYEDDAPLV